jgi:hypothetical protein
MEAPSHRTGLLHLHGLGIPPDAVVLGAQARDKAVEAHVWRVDGTLTREQQCVVQEAAESATEEWRHHWYLCG